MSGKALIVGNSGGIGLVTTRVLLEHGWKIAGKLSSLHVAVEQPMR
jgi:NAD(P)-dependent dehydrogenase (short-subunit alcohol dehydrogenase family)